jgi:hypothetical protein
MELFRIPVHWYPGDMTAPFFHIWTVAGICAAVAVKLAW